MVWSSPAARYNEMGLVRLQIYINIWFKSWHAHECHRVSLNIEYGLGPVGSMALCFLKRFYEHYILLSATSSGSLGCTDCYKLHTVPGLVIANKNKEWIPLVMLKNKESVDVSSVIHKHLTVLVRVRLMEFRTYPVNTGCEAGIHPEIHTCEHTPLHTMQGQPRVQPGKHLPACWWKLKNRENTCAWKLHHP